MIQFSVDRVATGDVVIDPDDALVVLNSTDGIGSEIVRARNVGQRQILVDVVAMMGFTGTWLLG
jgi:hypothetical protein